MLSEERTRWLKASFRIFGNDESLAMYRRTGGRCSSGGAYANWPAGQCQRRPGQRQRGQYFLGSAPGGFLAV